MKSGRDKVYDLAKQAVVSEVQKPFNNESEGKG
jgi:hypothetical protein